MEPLNIVQVVSPLDLYSVDEKGQVAPFETWIRSFRDARGRLHKIESLIQPRIAIKQGQRMRSQWNCDGDFTQDFSWHKMGPLAFSYAHSECLPLHPMVWSRMGRSEGIIVRDKWAQSANSEGEKQNKWMAMYPRKEDKQQSHSSKARIIICMQCRGGSYSNGLLLALKSVGKPLLVRQPSPRYTFPTTEVNSWIR